MKKTKMKFENLPKDYVSLCRLWMPRYIDDQITYQHAWEVIEPLMGREGQMTSEQEDYLETVTVLLEKYDTEHFSYPSLPSGVETLKYLLEQQQMTYSDLARILEVDASLGGKIARGERRLTLDHIKKLSKTFKISAEVFV